MKTRRLLSMLLALALVFGLLPTVLPAAVDAAVADTPAGVRNHLPSTATDVVYLSDMEWEYSINYQNKESIKNGAWSNGGAIVMGASTANGGTTFTKGLGVMPFNTNSDPNTASRTIFDLADNNYAQSYFYAAAGITNRNADALTNGLVFEVWGSYDKTQEDYTKAEYKLLERSGDPAKGTHVTKGNVYQFHVDVTGVRYLKLVVYAVGSISSTNANWAGVCVYNNPGYFPKSDLMGLNNGKDNSTWVPSGTDRFNTYHFNSLPADAVLLSGTDYKDATTYKGTAKMVEFQSASSHLGSGSHWFGGVADSLTNTNTNQKDGILLKDATKYWRFNARQPANSDNQSDGWVTFDISDLDVNRFYAAIGSGNGNTKHTAYNPSNGTCGGMVCQVWGAETQDGDYTLLAESEPIMLSQTGEFLVDITGVNFLKIRMQARDTRRIDALDMIFYMPSVFKDWDVSVTGADSVTRGLTANYAAVVRQNLEEIKDYTGTVTWTMTGAANANTTIDQNGKLTVNGSETATELQITASITEGEKTFTSALFTVAVTKAPVGVRNHLPSTAEDVVYLSDMDWEYSINYQNKEAIRNGAWTSGNIVMGATAANGGTTFEKGLGVMAISTDSDPDVASRTIFDLADNNYAQNYFYAAAGITNRNADALTNGLVFEVWGSYDKDQEDYTKAEYVLLERSGDPTLGTHVTKGYVHQFHVDVTGVRYLKLVVYAVEKINSMNANWAGVCVYNNPGYYPKTDLMGLNNGGNNATWVPSGEDRYNTYHFNSLPDDAVLLSGTTYKDASTYKGTAKMVDFKSASGHLGSGNHWFGGVAESLTNTNTNLKDGLLLTNAGEYFRFNCRTPANSDSQTDGWVTFDISDLNVNRFYAAVSGGNGNNKHLAYSPSNGAYGGVVCQVWGAETKDGEYTLLAESEPILLSNAGEFDVNITGVNFLKLRIQAKDARLINGLDTIFYRPSVFFDEWTATVTGEDSVLQGDNAQYTATVTREFAPKHNYTGPITWAVAGAAGANTKITNGKLVIDETESAASVNVTASINEAGHVLNSNTKTVTVLSAGDNVAYVEENGHGTLAEAIAAANGGEVTLVKNVALSEAVAVANETVTLDLNGKSLTGTTVATLGEGADLTIVTDGGKLTGEIQVAGNGAKLTADCDIDLNLNGKTATVNAEKVTLTDTATDNGTVGGKVYGDFTLANTVTKENGISYVAVPGTDTAGDYYTANAVRVKVKRINVRPGTAGLYYTTEVIFNQNIAALEASYGVALSLVDKPGSDFATDEDTLYTSFTAPTGADFNSVATSCLLNNILKAGDTENAANGAKEIHANAYVKVMVDGKEVVVMMENVADVNYSLKTVMQTLDTKLGQEVAGGSELSDTSKKALSFFETWQTDMADWGLTNMAAELAKNA